MSHDTWIHRIARVVVARPLAATSVSPNQLTTARLATGLASAAAIGSGLSLWQDIGAGIFVASMILDRADGDLARLTGKTSAAGHRYDMIADGVANAVIFFGLGFGLRDSAFGLLAIPMGLAAGVAVAAILRMAMWAEDHKGARAAELPAFAGFDVDDLMVLVPLAVWFGELELLLKAAAIGAPLFAAFFYWHVRRRLAAFQAK
ncbi:MAG: CDP-alcohol phosphatidyltransferase family protein [Rhodospirillales bacterium]|nr:CDP-alcohol phosphatidyltransferase family protein [Rhodospirillales bacterium]